MVQAVAKVTGTVRDPSQSLSAWITEASTSATDLHRTLTRVKDSSVKVQDASVSAASYRIDACLGPRIVVGAGNVAIDSQSVRPRSQSSEIRRGRPSSMPALLEDNPLPCVAIQISSSRRYAPLHLGHNQDFYDLTLCQYMMLARMQSPATCLFVLAGMSKLAAARWDFKIDHPCDTTE